MNAGWVGDFQPDNQRRSRLKDDLTRTCPVGDVIGFHSDVVRAISKYNSRKRQPVTSVQKRSTERYLAALAAGKKPRTRTPPSEICELIADLENSYSGDTRQAAAALLDETKKRARGRPSGALDDWLIAVSAQAYRNRFARAAISKNSRFAKQVLPCVFGAAGIPTQYVARISTAILRWPIG